MGYTKAQLHRIMSNLEFMEWLAFYNVEGQIASVQSRHPGWSSRQVMEWVEAQQSLRKKG